MKKSTTLITSGIGLTALIIGLVFATTHASAQGAPNSSGQALEIGPPVINLSADPGQTIKTTISLRDVSATNLLVSSQINDFVAGGEDGTPKIILDDTASAFSLKSWVSPLAPLTLKPKEVKTVSVTITVPANAAPGGYYAVIRFTGTPPELSGTGVSLSASLGSLIFLRINGIATENMTIEEFSTNNGGGSKTLFEFAPINFVQRLSNKGNIDEEPTALVTITDMFNNTLATLPISPPTRTLPQSIRKFSVPLDSTVIGNKILFGMYRADLTVTYGANKQTIKSSLTFWVIPYTLIIIIILALVASFFALRTFIKRYNRAIIARAKNKDSNK